MPKSAKPFSLRILALSFVFLALACSRAAPPLPTAATSATSGAADAPHTPDPQATAPAVPHASEMPPSAVAPNSATATAVPQAPASTSTPSPPTEPAARARASLWTNPQDCGVYDTSPDYRALSAEDRAHGRLTCETKEEFRAFVAGRQTCKAAADCAIVSGSCPFDCYVPIAKAHERQVRAKLDSLGTRLDKAGNRCMYGCMGSPKVECVDGRCDAGTR